MENGQLLNLHAAALIPFQQRNDDGDDDDDGGGDDAADDHLAC